MPEKRKKKRDQVNIHKSESGGLGKGGQERIERFVGMN